MSKVKASTIQIIETVLKGDNGVSELKKEQIKAILMDSKVPIAPKLLTQTEAAKWLGLSRVTVYAITKKGYLKPVIIGEGIKRYRVSDLERLIKERE